VLKKIKYAYFDIALSVESRQEGMTIAAEFR